MRHVSFWSHVRSDQIERIEVERGIPVVVSLSHRPSLHRPQRNRCKRSRPITEYIDAGDTLHGKHLRGLESAIATATPIASKKDSEHICNHSRTLRLDVYK